MVYTVGMVYTVEIREMRGMRGTTMVKTGLMAETHFRLLLSHAGVQEYFQIACRTRLSRSIFKLTVARRCP